MVQFINMALTGSQWFIEYNEDGIDKTNLYNTKEEATEFYNQII
jgi:hypothetical protein